MKSKLALAASVTVLSLGANLAHADSKVLILDQGADLTHEKLVGNIFENAAEKTGTPGFDDDKDGFKDDVTGWNAVSNDPIYMPDYVMNIFKQDPASMKAALELYSKVENGDKGALAQIQKNPMLMQIIGEVLDISHGTHVSGIVAKLGENTAKLQSVNVFLPSTQPKEETSPDEEGKPGLNHITLNRSVRDIRTQLLRAFANNKLITDTPSGDQTPAQPKKDPGSVFDDGTKIDSLLTEMLTESESMNTVLVSYVKAAKPAAVNLSLGSTKSQISEVAEQLWTQELQERGATAGTKRTSTQDGNFKRLIDGVFNAQVKGWNALFAANPETVFVIAAGNDGDNTPASKGSLDKFPGTPAMSSTDFPNVITVVATTKTGVIADFSSFSAKYANIAAWGVAVPSLAPDNNYVTLSGTSMAAPFVTGVVAKMRSLNPKLTPADVRKIIEKTGTVVGSLKGKCTSGAIINPTAAYTASTGALKANVDSAISKVKMTDPLNIRGSLDMNRGRILNPLSNNPAGSFGPETMEVDSFGKVFVTSPLVKHFIRRF